MFMKKEIMELISAMKQKEIDVFLVSDKDDHLSEYTGPHFHALEKFSGFTGGDGALAVTAEGEAALWTDGRYFTQAETELHGSGIGLMKMGEPGTPRITDWLMEKLPEHGVLGFDGTCTAYGEGKMLSEKAAERGGKILSIDLCDAVWTDRPENACTPCWILREEFTGKSAGDKLAKLRHYMKTAGADAHIIASLDDIAWLLNLRADDIPCNPVFSSWLLIEAEKNRLYLDPRHLADSDRSTAEELKAYLSANAVTLEPYDRIYKDLAELKGTVLLDPSRVNFEIAASFSADVRMIQEMNPSVKEKTRKNAVEVLNLHKAQHKDSVALTRFMFWFKKMLKEDPDVLTEWSCVEKLHAFRSEQEGFFEESFSTISAYGANAAMAHYQPSASADVPIEPHGLYLVDSGGQYPEGTTDVTRTWSCGPLTEQERDCFTLTAMAHLRLADFRFPEGASGICADGIARDVFWRRGLNFNHGTGHGVGFCLNVHEAPAGIRYRSATVEGAYGLYEGMYLSDEPGYYEAGKFGIRIENLLLVKHDFTNSYGRFCSFETMNFCPIDRDCINAELMEPEDIALYNAYHKKVFNELQQDLNAEEREWLRSMCEPIGKV